MEHRQFLRLIRRHNAKILCMGDHRKNIILLMCDAFGLLPPVARLTRTQAMYHVVLIRKKVVNAMNDHPLPVRSLDDQTAIPSGHATGVAAGFFFGRMPKKNRTTLKRLTSSSYRAMIRAKETAAMIRYFGKMP